MGKNAEAGQGRSIATTGARSLNCGRASPSRTRPVSRTGRAPRLFRGYRGAHRLAHLARRRRLAGRDPWEVWLDHRESGINPDGAVVDAEGRFWCAEWGAARVACYDPDGKTCRRNRARRAATHLPGLRRGRPSTLFVTTARQGLPTDEMDGAPRSGMTLSFPFRHSRAGGTPGDPVSLKRTLGTCYYPEHWPEERSGPRTPRAWRAWPDMGADRRIRLVAAGAGTGTLSTGPGWTGPSTC
jgi:hypothetical protein